MIDDLAKVLCRASTFQKSCPRCVDGQCDPLMWQTFKGEAKAVVQHLRAKGLLKETLLPGLGGGQFQSATRGPGK